MTAAETTFVWGLKRSGIHLVVNWLFANQGATVRTGLVADDLHPQLRDGFCDDGAGVAFYNNCGGLHSRQFELGDVTAADMEVAANRHRVTIFGIEDCSLEWSKTATLAGSMSILILRDPLNNLASRLEAATRRPEVFRVDEGYIDLYDAYCAEYLGRTSSLPDKVLVNFNRFVMERSYRDAIADALGLANLDEVSEVSEYGGGSSFQDDDGSFAERVMSRYRQHPLPRHIADMLVERAAIREACTMVFGYDLVLLAAGS